MTNPFSFFSTILLFLVSLPIVAQTMPEEAQKFASTIQESELKKHLYVIAADSMEGRYTGSEGQRKAAQYIVNEFQNLGLLAPVVSGKDSSYLQPFNFVKRKWTEAYIKVGESQKIFGEDFFIIGYSHFRNETTLNAVFVGDGLPEEYANIDLNGKIAVLRESKYEIRQITDSLRANGVKTVFVVSGKNTKDFKDVLKYNAYYIKKPIDEMSQPNRPDETVFYISPQVATEIFMLSAGEIFNVNSGELPEAEISIKADFEEKIYMQSENILGLLEGTDKKDEYLIITAHYDHIGTDKSGNVFNGADDDGSGTVGILEIAEAFIEAKKAGFSPRRSILFMTVSGEEIGLYGSRFYTDYQPIFPLEQTVANLNIDMIGRLDRKHYNNPNYIYLIGSDKLSDDLHNLSEMVNEEFVNLELDYTYNDENDPNRFYYRSDHYNFAKNNIPIIFYFNGVHEDYHQITDTPDKIKYSKLTKIVQLVFHTAWEITQREDRVIVDEWKKE